MANIMRTTFKITGAKEEISYLIDLLVKEYGMREPEYDIQELPDGKFEATGRAGFRWVLLGNLFGDDDHDFEKVVRGRDVTISMSGFDVHEGMSESCELDHRGLMKWKKECDVTYFYID